MNSTFGMGMDEYLVVCTGIERSLVEFYQKLNVHFVRDQVLCRVWSQVVAEKMEHVAQIDALGRRLGDAGKFELAMDPSRLLELAYLARTALLEVQKRKMQKKAIFKLAIRLEEIITGFYAEQAFGFADHRLQELFKEMARDGCERAEQFKEAYRAKTWLKDESKSKVARGWAGALPLAVNS